MAVPLGSPFGGAGCPVRSAPERATQCCLMMLLLSLRYPLSQPDGCQLSQRESQGLRRSRYAKSQFTPLPDENGCGVKGKYGIITETAHFSPENTLGG